jgi:hypothetical protein
VGAPPCLQAWWCICRHGPRGHFGKAYGDRAGLASGDGLRRLGVVAEEV